MFETSGLSTVRGITPFLTFVPPTTEEAGCIYILLSGKGVPINNNIRFFKLKTLRIGTNTASVISFSQGGVEEFGVHEIQKISLVDFFWLPPGVLCGAFLILVQTLPGW